MGDLASDYDTTIELIIGKYRRLQALDPNHELLQYIYEVTDEGFKLRISTQFLDRFTPKDKRQKHEKVIKVLASYFVALSDTVNVLEGRLPKIQRSAPRTLDDIPF